MAGVPLDEIVSALMPVIDAAVRANVAASTRTGGQATPRLVPGVVLDASGARCNVATDDHPGEYVPATRMHADITEGARVQVLFAGPGQVLAFGPIPD